MPSWCARLLFLTFVAVARSLECPAGQVVAEQLILEDASYSGTQPSSYAGDAILAYGEFDGVEARYKSGYITCDTRKASGPEFAWQACEKVYYNRAAAFEMKVNGVYVFAQPRWEQPATWSGNQEMGCSTIDEVPFSNGHVTCEGTVSLDQGDEISLGWYESFTGRLVSDNGGTIVIDLVGLKCTAPATTSSSTAAPSTSTPLPTTTPPPELPPPLECPAGQDVSEHLILRDASYSGAATASYSGADILAVGEFDGVQARYKSGFISCSSGYSGTEFAWQACESGPWGNRGAAFAMKVNGAFVFAQQSRWAAATGCSEIDEVPNRNGPVTCEGSVGLEEGDEITLGWWESFRGISVSDNSGTIVIDLVGLKCVPRAMPPSCEASGCLGQCYSSSNGVCFQAQRCPASGCSAFGLTQFACPGDPASPCFCSAGTSFCGELPPVEEEEEEEEEKEEEEEEEEGGGGACAGECPGACRNSANGACFARQPCPRAGCAVFGLSELACSGGAAGGGCFCPAGTEACEGEGASSPPQRACAAPQPAWSNCVESRCCDDGLLCYEQHQWYAQCRPAGQCPSGWTCVELQGPGASGADGDPPLAQSAAAAAAAASSGGAPQAGSAAGASGPSLGMLAALVGGGLVAVAVVVASAEIVRRRRAEAGSGADMGGAADIKSELAFPTAAEAAQCGRGEATVGPWKLAEQV